jgi:hypothetical protein
MSSLVYKQLETIASFKVGKGILKIIIMDFHARKKLTDDEVKVLFKKYKLAKV